MGPLSSFGIGFRKTPKTAYTRHNRVGYHGRKRRETHIWDPTINWPNC